MAADKVFGIKTTDETEKKARDLIDASGLSMKEWFEKLLAFSEVQNLKEGSGDYKQDLSELEMHTKRIYELTANMIQRANYIKDDAVKGLVTKLESRDLTIAELQETVKKLTDDTKRLEEETKQSNIDKQALSEQVDGLRSANENNQALILEYKDKIDTLSSLVNEYKGYATENTELKSKHAAELAEMKKEFEAKEDRMASAIAELNTTVREQEGMIEQLQDKLTRTIEDHQKEVDNLKVNLDNQLTQLTDRKELEKERALLELERKYQEKLEKAHEQYNEKLSALYEKLDRKEVAGEKGKKNE
jgi:chromosome segregation ATPase